MENLKFDFKKCLDWINSIENDFSIKIDEGNYVRHGYTIINMIKSIQIKEDLLQTLIDLKDKSTEMNDSSFLNLISKKHDYLRNQQFIVISSINTQIDRLKGFEKQEMEESKDKHMKFFHYNYNLLDMIKSDILNGYLFTTIKESTKKKKQPSAKVIMEFSKLINDKLKIYPKENEYANNDEKFRIIAEQIKRHFSYIYKSGTLENNDMKIEGYSKEVYDLLLEWQYRTEATKYLAKHNVRY